MAFTGLFEQKMRRGSGRMGRAPALEKSTLEWDKGCETLLNALASIPRELDLKIPARVSAHSIVSMVLAPGGAKILASPRL